MTILSRSIKQNELYICDISHKGVVHWGDPFYDSYGATLLLALELYREGCVSPGRAAELTGAGIEVIMESSARRQASWRNAEMDLAEDRATADRLKL